MTGTNTYTPTDLQYSIPEIWGSKMNLEFEAFLGAASFFENLSSELGVGDTLHIPDIYTNTFSPNTKSNGSEVTLQSPAQDEVQLVVDTWKEISFIIEDKEMVQLYNSSRLQMEYAKQAAYKLRKALDTSIMALASAVSGSVNDTASDVNDADIRNAIATLDAADVPQMDRMFFFHPNVYWKDIMAVQKYYDASQAGWNGNNPVPTGNLGSSGNAIRGQLYGIPVMVTTQVQADTASSAYYNLLAYKDAFCYAVQTRGGANVRVQSNYKLENLGLLVVADLLYGVKEMRDGAAVLIKSRQTGIVS
jgi:hypothetical protein